MTAVSGRGLLGLHMKDACGMISVVRCRRHSSSLLVPLCRRGQRLELIAGARARVRVCAATAAGNEDGARVSSGTLM